MKHTPYLPNGIALTVLAICTVFINTVISSPSDPLFPETALNFIPLKESNQADPDHYYLPDGKVVLFGDFNGVDGYSVNGMALFNADGTTDPEWARHLNYNDEIPSDTVWGYHPAGGEFFVVRRQGELNEYSTGIVHLTEKGNQWEFVTLEGPGNSWRLANTNGSIILLAESLGSRDFRIHKYVYSEITSNFVKEDLPNLSDLIDINIEALKILGNGKVLVVYRVDEGLGWEPKAVLIDEAGFSEQILADDIDLSSIGGVNILVSGDILLWGLDSGGDPIWFRFDQDGVNLPMFPLTGSGSLTLVQSVQEFGDGRLLAHINAGHAGSEAYLYGADGTYLEEVNYPEGFYSFISEPILFEDSLVYFRLHSGVAANPIPQHYRWNADTNTTTEGWYNIPTTKADITSFDTSAHGLVAIVAEPGGRYKNSATNLALIDVDGSLVGTFNPPVLIYERAQLLKNGRLLVVGAEELDENGELVNEKLYLLNRDGSVVSGWNCPLSGVDLVGVDVDGGAFIFYQNEEHERENGRVVKLLFDGGVDDSFVPFETGGAPRGVFSFGEKLYFFGKNDVQGSDFSDYVIVRDSDGTVELGFDDGFYNPRIADLVVSESAIRFAGDVSFGHDANIGQVLDLDGQLVESIGFFDKYENHDSFSFAFTRGPSFWPGGEFVEAIGNGSTGEEFIFLIEAGGIFTDIRSPEDTLDWNNFSSISGKDYNLYALGNVSGKNYFSPKLIRYSSKEALVSLPFSYQIAEEVEVVTANLWLKEEEDISVRWLIGDEVIPDEDGLELALPEFAPGLYTIEVLVGAEVIGSGTFELVSGAAPIVLGQTSSSVVGVFSSQSIVAYTESNSALTNITWYRDGVKVSDSAHYVIEEFNSENVGNYHFVISNPYGEARSDFLYKTFNGFYGSEIEFTTSKTVSSPPTYSTQYIGNEIWVFVSGKKIFHYKSASNIEPEAIEVISTGYTFEDGFSATARTYIHPELGIFRYEPFSENNICRIKKFDFEGNPDEDFGTIELPTSNIWTLAAIDSGDVFVSIKEAGTTEYPLSKISSNGAVNENFDWQGSSSFLVFASRFGSTESGYFVASDGRNLVRMYDPAGTQIGPTGAITRYENVSSQVYDQETIGYINENRETAFVRFLDQQFRIVNLDGSISTEYFNLGLGADFVIQNWFYFGQDSFENDYLVYLAAKDLENENDEWEFKFGLARASGDFVAEVSGSFIGKEDEVKGFNYDPETERFYLFSHGNPGTIYTPTVFEVYDLEGNLLENASYFGNRAGKNLTMLAGDGSGGFFLEGDFEKYQGFRTRGLVHLNPDITVDESYLAAQFEIVGDSPKIIYYSIEGIIVVQQLGSGHYIYQLISSDGSTLNEFETTDMNLFDRAYFDDQSNVYLIGNSDVTKFLSNGSKDETYQLNFNSSISGAYISNDGEIYSARSEYDSESNSYNDYAYIHDLVLGELVETFGLFSDPTRPSDIMVAEGVFYLSRFENNEWINYRILEDGTIDPEFKLAAGKRLTNWTVLTLSDGRLFVTETIGQNVFRSLFLSDGTSSKSAIELQLASNAMYAATVDGGLLEISSPVYPAYSYGSMKVFRQQFHPMVFLDKPLLKVPETSWVVLQPTIITEGEVSYQWLEGGNEITSEQSDSILISGLTIDTRGGYQLRVSNDTFSYTSSSVELSSYFPLSYKYDNETGVYSLTADVEPGSLWEIEISGALDDWEGMDGSPFLANEEGQILIDFDVVANAFIRAKRVN